MRLQKIDSAPAFLNEFSEALLDGFYLRDGEDFNDALARTAEAFCYGDYELAQRVYEAAHKGWFMFASPLLSNSPIGEWNEFPLTDWKSGDNLSAKHWKGETGRGMPISCFAMFIPDTIVGQMEANVELAALSVAGGGVGLHNGIRATTDKAPGPIPYMKTMDALIGYYRQGKCYLPGTEILSERGWIPIESVTRSDRVAMVDEDGVISFTTPTDIVNEHHEGHMVRFYNQNRGIDFHVTDDHSMVIQRKSRKNGWGEFEKIRASDVPTHNEARFVMSGLQFGLAEQPSALERLMIAFQADGSNSKEWRGRTWLTFHFAKERKIIELRSILDELEIDYTEVPTEQNTTKFYIAMPHMEKTLDWIGLDISPEKAAGYLKEIEKWDAHIKPSGAVVVSTTTEAVANKVQALAVVAGVSSRLTPRDRDETRQRIYDVYLSDSPYFTCETLEKTTYEYDGPVHCVTVPTGMIVVRNGSVPLVCGNTRRGATAYYLDVSHPDIVEHVNFRVPSGGDPARKADNRTQFHNAVNITDDFMAAVVAGDDFDLVCPHSGEVRETIKARGLWEEILKARALTGEPYLLNIDRANDALPQSQKDKGLRVNGSNICSEITLASDKDRTFVCCLSSLNLETYDEWKDTTIVADLVRFLDNVTQYFIENAPDELAKAVYSATQERALGVGTMGWHYYLQSKGIPFEGGGFGSGIQETHKIFKNIKGAAVSASKALAAERGEPSDMIGTGLRNSHLLALAPNSNNSIIVGTSPSIEPISGNAYSQSTRAGTFLVKNPYLGRLLDKVAVERLGIDFDKVESWKESQWTIIVKAGGSVQTLEYLTDDEKNLFKTAFEMDQHWLVEQADARQQYVCQAQSLNLFFPSGVSAVYFNSVHLKAMTSPYLKTVYYARMERGVNADTVKVIERQALVDWTTDDCVACSG